MNIYEIKRRISKTDSTFFSRDIMKFFGQTLKDFRVKKLRDGNYFFCAPYRKNGVVKEILTYVYMVDKNAVLHPGIYCLQFKLNYSEFIKDYVK